MIYWIQARSKYNFRVIYIMNEPNNFFVDPIDYEISMDTRYLRDTYGQYFKEISHNNSKIYIEEPLPEGKSRDYRYLATIATGINETSTIQNLVQLSSVDIWKKDLTNEADLEEISKAITLIKVAVESDDYESKEAQEFDRNIMLRDGSEVNVEYILYFPENTENILADMNQHIAE